MRIPVSTASSPELPSRPANTASSDSIHGIKASILIPGRGEPLNNGAIVIKEAKIAWVGHQTSIPAQYAHVRFKTVPVLMPGLWDCHMHYTGAGPGDTASYESGLGPIALFGARVSKELERTLLAGFTTVRETGGYAGEIFPAVKEGTLIGPNVYSSVGIMGITGGHSDIHSLPIDTVIGNARHSGGINQVCDGVSDCVKTVRLMVRRGAKLIKVCASGGVGSELDDPQDVQFSPEELKAIVDEAARTKRIVAAHCHGKEGIMNALHAGVRTIEHGSYLDEEAIALMKEKGAILIATRLIVEEGLKNPESWPPVSYQKLIKIRAQNKKSYALAVQHGVKIALGTDWTAGEHGKELEYAIEAGLTPLQAIEACTATSPETLGAHFAPLSGQLKEGYDADVIAVSANPLNDVKILGDPNNVTHVWKGGKLYKEE
ncbi:uncharacterized protein TRUGW13939_06713 [Talaromyces rugulosus]|uniref:Amidohydrolase-related domain-containing protein n=1 Tax=Talaromyces rugulosus TaxID=121627 RepID=A0A7H8R0L0_TALRU|nr:uncharacterized protein TRUGW13939_06713 [Talaromyces rugulosus]QKX59576.1 hypothetical protein TRUGW13939_06713 [Talaromyces rugulosus]